MENGKIHVIEGIESFSESDSINTEIVNCIRNGENVTIYSQFVGDTNDNISAKGLNSKDQSTPSWERGVIEEVLRNNAKSPKMIIVVAPSDNPLPLPSWNKVETRPKSDDPKEWEKWGRNTLIQKAWASKFPFLAEHCDCIPVNQRINGWRNRIENSESVQKYQEPNQDIFEQDSLIGEDIRDLFNNRKDIFEDDPYIGEDLEKLFKNEEEK